MYVNTFNATGKKKCIPTDCLLVDDQIILNGALYTWIKLLSYALVNIEIVSQLRYRL